MFRHATTLVGKRGNGGPTPGTSSRAQVADLLAHHGATILGTARRYSINREDAEDAYQRALEILLNRTTAIPPDELLPWIRTVVKHEAFAVRRQRLRAVPSGTGEELPAPRSLEAGTHDRVERYERLALGAEAMTRLKPQEVRCLLLLAEGLSYKQICEMTKWSYTKVNRCISEGRRRFRDEVAGLESGDECRRLRPWISEFADGELGEVELPRVRAHLKRCRSCRVALTDYRATPRQVAALLPPVAVLGAGADHGGLDSLQSLAVQVQERVYAIVFKAQAAIEVASAGKVAAVAASTAALAGGGVAAVRSLEPPPSRDRAHHRAAAPAPHRAVPVRQELPPRAPRLHDSGAPVSSPAGAARPEVVAAEPSSDFDLESSPEPPRAAAGARTEFGSPARSSSSAASAPPDGGGEFAP